jgi:3-oxoacyl-[acyl-carrier-protein] synthase II
LEELEHAKKRNAHIYAEILGYGITCDASHITQPRPDGEAAARAIHLALKDANIKPEQIDCISAHGTSTPLNDKTETMVIKKIFGNYAYKIPITALKSMIGHLIGGAGPVELIAGILSMENGLIPPTINYEYPDPECDLDYVPNEAREAKIDTILKSSFGFGGKNSALVMRGHV